MASRIVGKTVIPVLEVDGPWQDATAYLQGVVVGNGDRAYACHTAHTSASATEPGEGADWEDVWIQLAADGAEGPAGPAGPPGEGGGIEWMGVYEMDGLPSGSSQFVLLPPGASGSSLRVFGRLAVSGMGMPAPDITISLLAGVDELDSAVVAAVPGMGGHKLFDVELGPIDVGDYPYDATEFFVSFASSGSDGYSAIYTVQLI